MLPASFRLNAPHVEDEADLNPHQAVAASIDDAARPPRQTLGPSFRLNAPHVDEGEYLQPSFARRTNCSHTDAVRAVTYSSDGEHIQQPVNDPNSEEDDAEPTTASFTSPEQQQSCDDPTPPPPNSNSSERNSPDKQESKIPQRCTRKVAFASGIAIAAVILLAVLLSVYLPGNSSTPSNTSTLSAIKARGALRCGVGEQLGFSTLNKTTGQREGFEVDLCRAVGVAVFGQDGHTEYSVVSNDNQFISLQSNDVDLLVAGTSYTIQSDVFEPSANAGFTFSAPYLYSGLSFAGLPQFVACAEALQSTGDCSNLTICVQDGTAYRDTLTNLLPNFQGIKLAPAQSDLYSLFKGGLCAVIAGEGADLIEVAVREIGYTGEYTIGLNQFSKEPLSLVTRDDDVEWSNFVNWVLIGLLAAESKNITQAVATNVVANPTPSVDPSQMSFYDAVAAVGNYGEIYERNLGSLIPRAHVNMLNNGSFPLISSIPLGDVSVYGQGPMSGSKLEQIAQRGTLRCGVAENVFFSNLNVTTQQWSGFDIDFCRAVSAALFGPSSTPQFVEVTAANRFDELANGNIDVISRTTSETYLRNVDEPTTGKGFSFSQPYFYTGVQFGGVPPYVQCADNVFTSGSCGNILICVTNGTTTIDVVRRLFPDRFIIPTVSKEQAVQCLVTKQSNVVAGDGFDTANATIRLVYTGSYEEGTKLFTRDNLALVTNQDDPQWSSFVSLVVTGTMFAAELGYSQATFRRMPSVNLFGPAYFNMLRNVIQAVGSYSEVCERSATSKYPRSVINSISTVPYGPQHFPSPGLLGLV